MYEKGSINLSNHDLEKASFGSVVPLPLKESVDHITRTNGISYLAYVIRFIEFGNRADDHITRGGNIALKAPNGTVSLERMPLSIDELRLPRNNSDYYRFHVNLPRYIVDNQIERAHDQNISLAALFRKYMTWGIKIENLAEQGGSIYFESEVDSSRVFIPSSRRAPTSEFKSRYGLRLLKEEKEELEFRSDVRGLTLVALIARYISIGDIVRNLQEQEGARIVQPGDFLIDGKDKKALVNNATAKCNLVLSESEMQRLQGLANSLGLTFKGLLQYYINLGKMIDTSMDRFGRVVFPIRNNQGLIEQQKVIFI